MIDIENGATSFWIGGRWLRFCFVVCTLATTPVFAAKHTFNPSIGASVSYITNVAFVGDPSAERSDTSTRIGLRLRYQAETDMTLLTLQYSTNFDSFRRFQELDFVGHRVSARLVSNRGPLSALRVYGSLSLSQDDNFVPDPEADPDAPSLVDPFLIQRTRKWNLNARVLYRRELRHRWTMASSVSGSYSTVEPIGDAPNAPSTANLEDKQAAGVTFRLGHVLSARTRIGGVYSYGIIHQEKSGDENVHVVRFTLSQGVSKRVRLRVEAGAYQRTTETVDNDSDRNNGFSGSLRVVFNEDLMVGPFKLDFKLGAQPSTGGTLEGTSTNTTASVILTHPRTRTWSWSLFARFTNRIPFDRDLPIYNTFSTGFKAGKDLGRKFRLGGQAEYVTQSSSDTDRSTGSFFRVFAGLSWHPLAGSRIAGG